MKYEVLKTFTVDGIKDTFSADGIKFFKGSVFTKFEESGIQIQDIIIPYKILLEQGFIEEVKETSNPRWKVGDYVVTTSGEYIKIYSVKPSSFGGYFLYNGYTGESFRAPTPQELSTYFR